MNVGHTLNDLLFNVRHTIDDPLRFRCQTYNLCFFVNLMSDISLLLYSHYNVRHTLDASLYIECHRNIILSVESEYQAYH